jgi:uncharacterized membrane protein YfhO
MFADPTYPGWISTLDGQPAETATADVAFSSVRIPSGRHLVTRRYAPRSVIFGAAVSLAAFLALFLFRSRLAKGVPAAPLAEKE